jgi:DNA gyrase subunit A
MATRRGTVKKTPLAAFANIRANGIIAVDLRIDDALVNVALTSGNNNILLFSDAGRGIRFNEADVRSMGRVATGVRGMRLVKAGDSAEEVASEEGAAEDAATEPAVTEIVETGAASVIAMIVSEGGDILTVSENGFGKRTAIDDFPVHRRGGQGVIAQALNDKTGKLVGAIQVDDRHEVMLISEQGNLIRFKTTDVRTMGRNTQGVRLMRPNEGDRLVGIDRIETDGEEGNGNGNGAGAESAPGDAAPK